MDFRQGSDMIEFALWEGCRRGKETISWRAEWQLEAKRPLAEIQESARTIQVPPLLEGQQF